MLKGEEAMKELSWLLNLDKKDWEGHFNKGKHGYWLDDFDDVWVAIDNRTGECLVEEFETEELCIKWLNGEIDEIDLIL
jgi:hypothetical protein